MTKSADQVWIVHADPEACTVLRRLAGDPPGPSGPPEDFPLEGAPAPRAIVLHVGPDAAAALDFAHRASRRHPNAAWVLLRDPVGRADGAFAGLDAELLAWPAEADQLSRALARAVRGTPTGLRTRRQRDALARRYALTLGDLGLPDLAGFVGGRLLVRGEPGTGRMLVARVVHALADPPGALVQVDGGSADALDELARRLRDLDGERVVVCVERPERLRPVDQRELASWIELGAPSSTLEPDRTVWIGLVDELAGDAAPLDPALALALAGREIRLPPLRRRAGAAVRFANATLRALAAANGATPRPLSAEAQEWIAGAPWPGNFRELEAVLRRALARGGDGELDVAALRAAGATDAPRPAARPQSGSATERPERPTAPRRPTKPMPGLIPPPGRARPAGAQPPGARPSEAAPGASEGPAAAARKPAGEEPTSSAPKAPRDLLESLAHSLRNPLVSLKTLASLGSEADETFLDQARRDLGGLEGRLDRLGRYAEIDFTERKAVNVAAMLEGLLAERRREIKRRRLLVLSELGADAPWALGAADGLHFAFENLLDATFAHIGDRQDLYLAARKPSASGAVDRLRILMRFHGAPLATLPGEGRGPAAIELVLAEASLEAMGGHLHHESLANGEQVVRVDLPAASGETV